MPCSANRNSEWFGIGIFSRYEVAISMEFSFFERFSEKQVREMVKVLQVVRRGCSQ